MRTKEITQKQVREWFIDGIDADELPANCPLAFAEICERLADDETPTPDGQMHFIREYGSTFAQAVRAYRQVEEDAAAKHEADFQAEARLEAQTALSAMSGDGGFDTLDEGGREMARTLAIEQLRYQAALSKRAAQILAKGAHLPERKDENGT